MILKLSTARQMHLYLGLFFAPSIIFFASTGSSMVFSLHENHDGYEPPGWVEVYMSFIYNKNHRLLWGLLIIGIALPAALLLMQ